MATVFIVDGYGYDAFESCMKTYADAFATREQAEQCFNKIIEEQSLFGSADNGMNYHETICRKNGKLTEYSLKQVYDLRIPDHRELFLYATTIVNAGLNPEEFNPDISHPARAIRTMTITQIQIKEQELHYEQNESKV